MSELDRISQDETIAMLARRLVELDRHYAPRLHPANNTVWE